MGNRDRTFCLTRLRDLLLQVANYDLILMALIFFVYMIDIVLFRLELFTYVKLYRLELEVLHSVRVYNPTIAIYSRYWLEVLYRTKTTSKSPT